MVILRGVYGHFEGRKRSIVRQNHCRRSAKLRVSAPGAGFLPVGKRGHSGLTDGKTRGKGGLGEGG